MQFGTRPVDGYDAAKEIITLWLDQALGLGIANLAGFEVIGGA